MTNDDDRSQQELEGDASSVKSDAVECDDDDNDDDDEDDEEDDIGIIFTVPTKASVHEGKSCLDKKHDMSPSSTNAAPTSWLPNPMVIYYYRFKQCSRAIFVICTIIVTNHDCGS